MGKLPTVWGNSLETESGNVIELGTTKWDEWLGSHKSFRYEPDAGNGFTVRQEKAGYWYGYRKISGRLHKRYIGTSRELTSSHLNEVSQLLEHPPQQRGNQVTDEVTPKVTDNQQYVTREEFENLNLQIASLREELRGKLKAR